MRRTTLVLIVSVIAHLLGASAALAQRFEDLPGHDRWKLVSDAMDRLAIGGRVSDVTWIEDGSGVEFRVGTPAGAERRRFVFATGAIEPVVGDAAAEGDSPRRSRGNRPARGRQADIVRSPDGAWNAVCEEHNVILKRVDGSAARAVTTDGTFKLGYGRASWVYGEELDQDSAMWWSPDSRFLAYYEFDDRNVPDFPLPVDWTALRPRVALESYPKAGDPNPIARLRVIEVGEIASRAELASAPMGQSISVDVGSDTEQYIYDIRWTPDSSALLFNRTGRRQDRLELVAADPLSGATRVVLTESQPTFQENRPTMRFLEDGVRFIWESEATGWSQFSIRSLADDSVVALTSGAYPALDIVQIDEKAGWFYLTAASGSVGMSAQLHRVRLDGSEHARLTVSELNHSNFSIAPNHTRFVCVAEAADTPPISTLLDMKGSILGVLAESDTSVMQELGLVAPELFSFKADDGTTDLFGILHRPAHFDPARTYPLIIDVYGGPGVVTVRNRWSGARPDCELGYLIAQIQNRGTPDRGKAFETATYQRLGDLDLKDQADGVRALSGRPYVDGSRVGITGGSYGGYMSALALLKHPDVFKAAVAISAVTDWRHYDSIYTERYMRLPRENEAGYDQGSCVKLAAALTPELARQLGGRLLLMHGMADDNVHPNNVWQFVHALQQANIPFDMMFFPTMDHGVFGPAVRSEKWSFFQRTLRPEAAERRLAPTESSAAPPHEECRVRGTCLPLGTIDTALASPAWSIESSG